MKKVEAVKKIKSYVKTMKPCPFCGTVPNFTYRVDKKDHGGSTGHFIKLENCCKIQTGIVDLFFCNDNKPANYGLWEQMAYYLIYYWNERKT